MRRLKRIGRWLRRDDGVSMVLVGVALAVLLGLAGMAVDLGVVYAERRELRTGADAAALAIAEDCGMQTRPCDEATAQATAQEYADANAWDHASTVDSIQLTLGGGNTGTVRVVTSAWDAAADQPGVRVPLLSMLGFNRVQVGAAATAIFSGLSAEEGGLPLIIDTCEFHTAGGYGRGRSVTLIFKDPKKDPEALCASDPAGKDAPGAFGWLTTPDKNHCRTGLLTIGDLADADPGYSPSKGCKQNPPAVDTDYLIPLYSEVGGQGNNTWYRVFGFASFHLEGYSFPNWGTYGAGCGGPGYSVGCITGYFVNDTVYQGEPGGPNFGVVLVKLIE
jgi:Flp pilus assembly protein TadG